MNHIFQLHSRNCDFCEVEKETEQYVYLRKNIISELKLCPLRSPMNPFHYQINQRRITNEFYVFGMLVKNMHVADPKHFLARYVKRLCQNSHSYYHWYKGRSYQNKCLQMMWMVLQHLNAQEHRHGYFLEQEHLLLREG